MKKIGIVGGIGPESTLDKDEFGIPFLNTTAIHVESIVKYCLRE